MQVAAADARALSLSSCQFGKAAPLGWRCCSVALWRQLETHIAKLKTVGIYTVESSAEC